MKKETVTATQICDLTDALEGRHFHWLSIGAKRDVLMLSLEEPVQNSGSALKIKNKSHHFNLHRWHNQVVQKIELPPTQQVFYESQMMGKESYLCVAGRCDKEEDNAHVFNNNGKLLYSWHVGDGVEDVQTTTNQEVWVSYFDEGVFSGMQLSGQGLNCFDAQGQVIFGFLTDTVGKAGFICDCYALNVASNNDTWLFYS